MQKRWRSVGARSILLTITFDPVRDTPEVMAKHAHIWNVDLKVWHFLTGPASDVQKVCGMFGVAAWQDEGILTHSLHTVVIDRSAKLAANIEGNSYTAKQLGDLVEASSAGADDYPACADKLRHMATRIFCVLLFALTLHGPVDSSTEAGTSADREATRTGSLSTTGAMRFSLKSANCVWVIFRDYVLAVDANYPWGAQEIVSEIRKTTSKPIRFVFNTHYHDDHSMGNSVFVDAGRYGCFIHTATAMEAQGASKAAWVRGTGPGGFSLKEFRPEYPTLTFENKLVFDDGEHRVELIRMGPAHTLGDSVAYLPNEKILATGDLFVNGNPWGNNVADVHADYDKWLQVLDTLASWDVTTVVPGHGDIGTTATLRAQRAFLADMLQQTRAGIAAGKTVEQLVNEVRPEQTR